jgi:hypothetical protein
VGRSLLFQGAIPFVAADVVRLGISIAFPILSLWLPSLMRCRRDGGDPAARTGRPHRRGHGKVAAMEVRIALTACRDAPEWAIRISPAPIGALRAAWLKSGLVQEAPMVT